MNKKKSIIIFALFPLIAVLIFFVCKHYDRLEIIRTTQEWARLASFPDKANIVLVKKSGSMFTREFQVKFIAPKADVRKWLRDSPGTSQVNPLIESGVEKYSIKPADKVSFAEVTYTEQVDEISIHVYWD